MTKILKRVNKFPLSFDLPNPPYLRFGDVHLWNFFLDSQDAGNFNSLICAEELKRANRFHLQEDRERFVKSHGLLRCLLSLYLKVEPEEIKFDYGTHGKPFLAENIPKSLSFNVSHSKNVMLCAVTQRGEIGVDIEYIQPGFDWEAAAELFYSASEICAIKSLPEKFQAKAFFQSWTRKEALGKAFGTGLSVPLDPLETSQWVTHDVSRINGYSAAIAGKNLLNKIIYLNENL